MSGSAPLPSQAAKEAGLYGPYEAFAPEVFDAAYGLCRDGRVEVVSRSRDGRSVFGQIRVSVRKVFQIQLKTSDEARPFTGECSCGQAHCVHLCALALTLEPLPLEQAGAKSKEAKTGLIQTTAVTEPVASPKPHDSRRLVFVFNPGLESSTRPFAPHVEVEHLEQGQRRFFEYRERPNAPPPAFVGKREQDWLGRWQASQSPDKADAGLLSEILRDGRCYLEPKGLEMQLAEPECIQYRWLLHPDGVQTLDWVLDERQILLVFGGFWYLDRVDGRCGPIQTGLPAKLEQLFLRHTSIQPEHLARVRSSMLAQKPGQDIALPKALDYERLKGKSPEPVLIIGASQSTAQSPYHADIECRLLFRYQGHLLPSTRSDTLLKGTRILSIERNQQAELKALEALRDFYPLHPINPFERHLGVEFWRLHAPNLLQSLMALGWEVRQAHGLSTKVLFADAWQLEIREIGDELRLFCWCVHQEKKTDLLPLLRQALAARMQIFEPQYLAQCTAGHLLCLPDGADLLLSMEAGLARILIDSLFELQSPAKAATSGLLLSPARAASLSLLLEEAKGLQLSWQIPKAVAELAAALKLKEQGEVELPSGLQCELRPYQLQGLSWLQLLGRHGLGGILADDMGLGKTLQCLAWVLSRRATATRPALVVAPKSLLGNWRTEARRFAPSLKVLVLDGPERQRYFSQIPKQDLVITSYSLLCRDQEALAAQRFDALILDEAQWVKNPSSQTAQATRRLHADNRLCLTGTPLENHLGELWALFDFLMPGFLGGPNIFKKLVRDPIEKEQDTETNQRLAKRIGPFLLRRTKAEVLPELPPKTEIPRHLDMDEGQQQLYENIRGLIYPQLKEKLAEQGLKASSINILDALLKLRQVCCDPRLLKGLGLEEEAQRAGSIKLDYLRDLLPELVAEGRRILLFSQFTSMLELIEQELKVLSIPWLKLTGKSQRRDLLVDKFQRGEVPVFLISLKAGGVGLNLTAADTLIHFDPWWNPAVERQATDRAHRIGQDKPVFVYKLICAGSVEARIQELQARKQALADNLLSASEGLATTWNEEDLEYLFAPLGFSA